MKAYTLLSNYKVKDIKRYRKKNQYDNIKGHYYRDGKKINVTIPYKIYIDAVNNINKKREEINQMTITINKLKKQLHTEKKEREKENKKYEKQIKTFQEEIYNYNNKKVTSKYIDEIEQDIISFDVKQPIIKKPFNKSLINKEYTLIKNIPFTTLYKDLITDGTIEKIYNPNYEQAKKKHPGGLYIFIKFILSDVTFNHEKGYTEYKSFVIKGHEENITREAIQNLIISESKKMYNTEDYILLLTSVNILIAPFGNKGGCTDSKTKTMKLVKSKNEKIVLKTFESKNNNCLFVCLNYFYDVKGNKYKPDEIRKELNIPLNEKIHYQKINEITKWYNTKFNKNYGFHIINSDYETLTFKNSDEKLCNIMLHNEHYFIFEVLSYVKCSKCGRKLLNNSMSSHVCSLKMISFFNKQVKTNNHKNIVDAKDIKENEELDYNKMVYWDIETFMYNNKFVTYASSYNTENKTTLYYGQDSLNKTLDDFEKMSNKIITAYNGSRFDFYFLLDHLTNKNIKIENLILSNGRILGFSFGDNNKIFDLCLFVQLSLKKACEAFNTEVTKGDFNHNNIKNWVDVETHKNEVIEYLKLDVLSLKSLFEKFNHLFYTLPLSDKEGDILGLNVTSYVTLSHMSYDIWRSFNKEILELPDMKKYKFIKRGTYGGRTYPMQKHFKSKHYDDVKSGKMLYDDLVKSNHFIFNADVSSLYPASMKGNDLVNVEYPTKYSSWSNDPKKCFDEGKLGFYEINYEPPTNITVPILPKKKYNGNQIVGVEWDLLPGNNEVYTSVDIKNALDAGYKINFVNECLIYEDKSSEVFTKYINTFYKLKEDSEKEKNSCLRNIAKLMLNGLYGKTLQKAIFETTIIINNIFEFNDFIQKYDLKDYELINDNKMLVTGTSKEAIQEEKITKPPQLGAFVTAYSRRFMLYFMKAIDPTLTTQIFTYTDTDSLHIFGEHYKLLKEKGLIVDKKNSKLGYMCSDIDNEGIIIEEKNIAPKTYLYRYIDNSNKLGKTNKCKGIPKDLLKEEFFENETGDVEFTTFKKVHKTVTRKEKEKGISNFNIYISDSKRTFNKTIWSAFELHENNYWLPKGYIKDL
jgi:hypothetical protein